MNCLLVPSSNHEPLNLMAQSEVPTTRCVGCELDLRQFLRPKIGALPGTNGTKLTMVFSASSTKWPGRATLMHECNVSCYPQYSKLFINQTSHYRLADDSWTEYRDIRFNQVGLFPKKEIYRWAERFQRSWTERHVLITVFYSVEPLSWECADYKKWKISILEHIDIERFISEGPSGKVLPRMKVTR